MKRLICQPPRVAIVLNGTYSTNSDLLKGVLRFTQIRSPWLTDIRTGRDGESLALDLDREALDGLIISSKFKSLVATANRHGIPTVLDGTPVPMKKAVAVLMCDNATVADRAAKHLLQCGFSHFAFVPEPSGQWWSRERLAVYRKCVRLQPGSSFHLYDFRKSALEQWLAELPKPVGIFAADDIRARQVSDAARLVGAKIPGEIAVLGVDNDSVLCETTSPSLSSVQLHMQDAGFLAAECLHDVMTGGREIPARPLMIRFDGDVIARDSTHTLVTDDPLVSRCRELLQNNLRTAISVEDLLPVLHVSRRTLELRFKAATGRTIHEDLLRIRIEHAKALLRDGRLSQERVAVASGFHDASHLNVVFRRTLNALPSEFRTGIDLTERMSSQRPVPRRAGCPHGGSRTRSADVR